MSDRTPPRDARKIHIPAPAEGGASGPPSRPAPSARTAAPQARSTSSTRPSTPPPRTTRPAKEPVRNRGGKRRRFLPHRPKLRRVLLLLPILLPLLLLLLAAGGWFYARGVYDEVEKLPLSDVLSTGGSGTNYLVVGSDSREVEDLVDAGLDPGLFEDGGGQRSDTMLVLRFVDGKARMLSVPRDLYVTIAETGAKAKINAAYNGGPRRLILTIQEALGLPIHHYLEVDFVSFARLVDALGGIELDFEHPALDTSSGLFIEQAGRVTLDGPTSLAYVRSRNYTEIIDGRRVLEPTADLGRVQRQQRFLTAVFDKLGESRNPLTLARAADSTAAGLRVDDALGLTEAARLAWRLRALDPEPVLLPTRGGNNSAGSVLFLIEPDAGDVLATMR